MKSHLKACLVTFLATLQLLHGEDARPSGAWPDAATFATPPNRYGVETYLYWINGNITKDGITKDFEAMRDQGITRVMQRSVTMGPNGPVSPLLSDLWLDHWRFMAAEANRTGVKLATQLGPGWSESSGPWIKPENSMKRVVWSHQIVSGGHPVKLDLPPLPALLNWSKDIAVLALPVNGKQASRMEGCTVLSNGTTVPDQVLFDGSPATGADSDDPAKWRLDFTFPSPHECNRAHFFLRWKDHSPMPNKIRVTIQADGKPLVKTEINSFSFAGGLDIPFPAVKAAQLSVEFEFVNSVEFTQWATFRHVKMAEAELLQGSESPQWDCELQNLAQQSEDCGFLGTPKWSKGESHPIDAAQILDLTSQVKDGHLKWDAPAGTWRVVRFGFTTTGKGGSVPQPTKDGVGLESDKMSVAATDLHFNSYVKRLIEAIPADQRKALDAIDLDSWEASCQNWTDDFPTEFNRRRGYSILPFLSVFAGEVVGSRSETERFLNDFRETIADLITERFYARNTQLVHEQNLQFVAQISEVDIPFMDAFPLARIVDRPMDEFWSDQGDGTLPPITDKPLRNTLIPEAAFVAGKSIVATESFSSNQCEYERTPGDYGYVGDLALFWGYNNFVLNTYVQQPGDKPPGWTVMQAGPPLNRLITWWPMIGSWLREISRAQYLLQTSTPVYDVLVYHGDSMPRPRPETPGLPDGVRRLRIDQVALKQLKVIDGQLTLNGTDRYRALIVPSNRLRAETVETVLHLVQGGALVAASRPGPAPGWSNHEEEDRRIEAIANQIWGSPGTFPQFPVTVAKGKIYDYTADDIHRLFSENGFQPNLTSSAQGSGAKLMIQHRRAGGADLYGLFNPNETATTYDCVVVDASNRTPEIWSPLTGKREFLHPFKREKGTITFPLTVESRRTLYLVLSTSAAPASSATPPPSGPQKIFAVTTPFTVTFNGLPGLSAQSLQPPASWADIADPQIHDYSGIAVYKTEFTLPPDFPTAGPVTLDLGEVGKVARVTLNGHDVGTLWRAPWQLETSPFIKSGKNTLQIEVANTWLNRMLADSALPVADRTTFTTWKTQWWTDHKVTREKSGLLGDITLKANRRSGGR